MPCNKHMAVICIVLKGDRVSKPDLVAIWIGIYVSLNSIFLSSPG